MIRVLVLLDHNDSNLVAVMAVNGKMTVLLEEDSVSWAKRRPLSIFGFLVQFFQGERGVLLNFDSTVDVTPQAIRNKLMFSLPDPTKPAWLPLLDSVARVNMFQTQGRIVSKPHIEGKIINLGVDRPIQPDTPICIQWGKETMTAAAKEFEVLV